jgi:hypothetical protein
MKGKAVSGWRLAVSLEVASGRFSYRKARMFQVE